MSKRGRYEGALWQANMLESIFKRDGESVGDDDDGSGGAGDAGVHAMDDSAYFARFGEAAPQRRGEHAGVHPGTHRVQG